MKRLLLLALALLLAVPTVTEAVPCRRLCKQAEAICRSADWPPFIRNCRKPLRRACKREGAVACGIKTASVTSYGVRYDITLTARTMGVWVTALTREPVQVCNFDVAVIQNGHQFQATGHCLRVAPGVTMEWPPTFLPDGFDMSAPFSVVVIG